MRGVVSAELARDEGLGEFGVIRALYAARCDGRDADLAALRLQPGDFAHWQRERFRNAALADSLTYWKQRLSGAAPVLTLPWDRPRPTGWRRWPYVLRRP